MTTLIGLALMTLLAGMAVFLLVHRLSRGIVAELAPPEIRVKIRKTQELARRPFFWLALARRIERYVPEKVGRTTTRLITMAGGLEGLTPAELTLYSVTGLMVGLTAGMLVIATTSWTPWTVLLLCAVGAVLPVIWLRDQVKKRHNELMRDLPFHLDLLTLSVEAGLDFAAAVARVVERGRPGALHEELNSFLGEIRMGKTRAESLQSMSDRVGLAALSNFLAALIQADRLGSGLGRTLRLQAEQLRSERFQRAEKAAGEAPVKMLIPLVLFIFPTLWIILAAPIVFEWIFKGVMM
jgi:tight adherence protein C